MNRLLLIVTVIAFAAVASAGDVNSEGTALKIDVENSKVFWTGKKVSGEHTGFVAIKKGQVFVENNQVVGATVHMDMNAIECTDLEGEWKDKLVGHLKSDDFFSVEKFPMAMFEITDMKMMDGKQNVVGNLTIKGMTHEIAFPVETMVKDGMVKASGTAVIDRTKWNIKYGSGKFFKGLGDRLIYDDFEIKFELVAKAN